MRRITICLPDALYKQLRQEAIVCHQSLASLIRARLTPSRTRKQRFDLKLDPLIRVAVLAAAQFLPTPSIKSCMSSEFFEFALRIIGDIP